MSWTKYGPSANGCRFYANVLRKLARTPDAPIGKVQRRKLTEAAEIFDELWKEQRDLASFLKNTTGPAHAPGEE